jgi:hypothetical protein
MVLIVLVEKKKKKMHKKKNLLYPGDSTGAYGLMCLVMFIIVIVLLCVLTEQNIQRTSYIDDCYTDSFYPPCANMTRATEHIALGLCVKYENTYLYFKSHLDTKENAIVMLNVGHIMNHWPEKEWSNTVYVIGESPSIM